MFCSFWRFLAFFLICFSNVSAKNAAFQKAGSLVASSDNQI
jgi:hypothetical protein